MQTNYYVGMDLHSNNTYIGVLDEQERRVWSGKIANEFEAILNALKPFQDHVVGIVVESTFNWYWLVDGLMEQGYKLHLANPVAFQQYRGIKFTDDKHDAFFLARMLRLGILPEGYIYPKEERQVRDLLRKRLMLVRQRSQHILSFQSLVNRNLGFSLDSNQVKKLKSDDIADWFSSEHLFYSARTNLDAIDYLKKEIRDLEWIIQHSSVLHHKQELLSTVPGIGKALSMTIALETGDISRFKTVGDYASYCRCVPSNRISNGKSKGKNNSKNGNKYLSWAYVEAANFIKRFNPRARVFFDKKAKQRNQTVATKALAHKVARACFYILRDEVPFDELKMFCNPNPCDKGSSSEPERGLHRECIAPIGPSAAANLNE